MTPTPLPENTVPVAEVAPGDGRHAAHAHSRLFRRVNRRLARMSRMGAAVTLTIFAVFVALVLCWALSAFGVVHLTFPLVISAIAITVLNTAPVTYAAAGIIRELNASRRALTLMTEKLAVAFHAAEQANEAKSKFLANMSHELRTPLNAIIGFSDIMQNQRFGPLENPRYREYAGDINASGTHLLGIINDILDLAKIESGQATIESESEFDAVALVRSACTMVGPLATRQNVELLLDLPAHPVGLVAVERMIRQMLLNILSNALKFTPPSGVVGLRLELRPNGNLAMMITDTGVGMSASDIKVAMAPFGQVRNAMSASQAGTGLGLPLTKAMMGLHDGKLKIRSRPGEGTSVALIFPAARVKPALAEIAKAS